MIEDGTFREDLFYRLNVMPIFLPPLRDRIDDLPELAQYFMKRFARAHSRAITSISDEAMDVLKKYRWPGNIRELENVIERSFIVENSDRITVQSLPEALITKAKEQMQPLQAANIAAGGALNYESFKEQAEKEFIISALRANKGRINKTVAEANIPKNTLLRKIKRYEINVDEYKD